MVHYGGQIAVRSGLLDKICRLLREGGVDYITLGGVVPNPRLSKVHEGIDLCRKEGVDFILAVGGGSVIDSSKAIALGVCYDRKRLIHRKKVDSPHRQTAAGFSSETGGGYLFIYREKSQD